MKRSPISNVQHIYFTSIERHTVGYNSSYNYGMTDFELLLCTPPYNTDHERKPATVMSNGKDEVLKT